MNTKNAYLIAAGMLNLFTFFLHLIGGQFDLVNPMIETTLTIEQSSQLVGAWHMVTLILFVTSYILLSAGFGKKYTENSEMIKLALYLNLAFCLPSIFASIYYGLLVPQWILFLPMGILTIIGIKKSQRIVTQVA